MDHQTEPNTMMRDIYNNLTDNGVGFLTVPNSDYIFNNGTFYQIIQDNLIYFSKESLFFFIQKETNRPFLEASDIFRYKFKQGKFLSQISFYYSRDKINIFEKKEIIFMARIKNFIRCYVAPSGYFGGKVNVLYDFKVDKRYILGLLNSKLMSYFYAQKYFALHMQDGAFGFDTLSVGNLPIQKPNSANQSLVDEIINLVDRIIEGKKSGIDMRELEEEVDRLVWLKPAFGAGFMS